LSKLADEGKLRAELAAQTKRMLADPRSSAFLDRFTQEWLGLAKLATLMPETSLFGRFDKQGLLPLDMAEEPRAMLGYLLRENQSLFDLLDSNYTFLNDRLADFYHLPSLWSLFPLKREGFEPISGGEMRKVTLPDKRRGGLVTMGRSWRKPAKTHARRQSDAACGFSRKFSTARHRLHHRMSMAFFQPPARARQPLRR
jgi:hypothetical protein